jgi:hypothetical protein
LLADGTQTGLSSSLTWSSGTITPNKLSFGGNDAGKSLILPKDKNRVVSEETGSILFDYNATDNLLVHDGADWVTFPNETAVAEIIKDDFIDWSVPVKITTDTLDYSLGSRFYIDETNPYFVEDSITVPVHGKLYLKNSNSVYKPVQVLVYDEAAVTSIFDNGVGHYVRFPDGVTEVSCSDDDGFVTFSIEVADATHRYLVYGQQYADWD